MRLNKAVHGDCAFEQLFALNAGGQGKRLRASGAMSHLSPSS